MAFRNLVSNQVDNAFRLAGDLLTEVTLSAASQQGGYNFDTGEIDIVDAAPVTVRGILSVQRREEYLQAEVILKSSDVDFNIDVYTKVTVQGRTYSLQSWFDDSYIIRLDVRVEA